MGNYSADRDELNRRIDEYVNVIEEWNENQTMFSRIYNEVVKTDDDEITEATEEKQAVANFWNGIVSADQNASTGFNKVTQDLSVLSSTIDAFLDELGSGGANLEKLNVNNLYQAMFKDQKLFDNLMEKMLTNQVLTPAEREMLYHFIQAEILTDETVEQLEEISTLIGEGRFNEVEAYLSELLQSEEAFDRHIATVQAYIFTNDDTPDQEHKLLQGYLAILSGVKDYRDEAITFTGETDVEKLRLTIELSSRRTTSPDNYQILATINTAELNPDDIDDVSLYFYVLQDHFLVKIYNSPNVANQLNREENAELREKYSSYTKDFWTKELAKTILTESASQSHEAVGYSVDALFTLGDYLGGKKELENQITTSDLQSITSELELELLTVDKHSSPDSHYQFISTEKTYERLKRWEEVHRLNPNIPYPKEAIDKRDWNDIADVYLYLRDKFVDDNGNALLNYIIHGNLVRNLTLEEIVAEHNW
ncbi:hypothetical protein [Amphibacillus jilinensis]|uniref:hypothetical protein n=1 Tax=Amphibacillus jilinensis TaxID=1216008 RepID=UPI000300B433|nr:hypothetical protein [Amphibacillus jilinensis]